MADFARWFHAIAVYTSVSVRYKRFHTRFLSTAAENKYNEHLFLYILFITQTFDSLKNTLNKSEGKL